MPNNTITLNNGVQMPALGLGVFQTPPDVTTAVVEQALRLGYRHFDAAAYLNEREVGEGLRRCGVPRGDVFVETKVWIGDYGYDATLHAFDKNAGKLGVDQLDLLILHQPPPSAFDHTARPLPRRLRPPHRRPALRRHRVCCSRTSPGPARTTTTATQESSRSATPKWWPA